MVLKTKDIPVSMAASWSWGASLLVGMSIAAQFGFIPYLLWVFFNVLSMPLLGELHSRFKIVRRWSNVKVFTFVWAYVAIYSILINMSFLRDVLSGRIHDMPTMVLSVPAASVLVIFVSFVAWEIVRRTGLAGSVFTDRYQYAAQLVLTITLCAVAFATGSSGTPMIEGEWSQWLPMACLSILLGASASGMQWQRLEQLPVKERRLAAWKAGGLFGLYMLAVAFIVWNYTGTVAELALVIGIVFAITTSTIDSGFAALSYCFSNLGWPRVLSVYLGYALVIAGLLAVRLGVVELWTVFSGVRWIMVATMMFGSLVVTYFKRLGVKSGS